MTSTCITAVRGMQIFDSRGRPTIEVDVELSGGATGRASAPSGASTGIHEAHELRDGDASVHGGRGVLRAVANVNGEIDRLVAGKDALDQAALDSAMREADGTANLSRLGANAVLATSLAICRAAANAQTVPMYRYIATLANNAALSMPMPMVNILSGGAHAGRGMDVQDFLVVPVAATRFGDALTMALRIRQAAADVAASGGLPTLLADEGGLSPAFKRTDEALALMMKSIRAAGFAPGDEAAIAIDVASSEFFAGDHYHLRNEGRRLTRDDMIATTLHWLKKYPIVSVEDALHQDDWEGWSTLTATAPDVQILGDDLFATAVARIEHGIRLRAANAVLIKVNQNGTLSGALEAMHTARRGGYATIVSARSGETDDSFIADLAVGTGAGQIKIGSVRTSERMSKYNRLLRIEAENPDMEFSRPF